MAEESAESCREMMHTISDLGSHFSKMRFAETKRTNSLEEWLDATEEKIRVWDLEGPMIWDFQATEASEYLKAVNELQVFSENLKSLQLQNVGLQASEILSRVQNILQMAMVKLEEEFVHLLVQYRQPLELDHLSFHSTEQDVVDDYSSRLQDDESITLSADMEIGRSSGHFVADLIQPDVIADLRCIAVAMFTSSRDKECCQAYVDARKNVLDECLSTLHVEKFSTEDILAMDWNILNTNIKRWNKAMKVFVRVYLASEQHLCDQIFDGIPGSPSGTLFLDASKGSMMQLLYMGEAITVGPPSPERLFRLLDMYDCFADLVPDIKDLYGEKHSSCILNELHQVLARLGECIQAIFNEFRNAIQNDLSTIPFSGGGVHPLTRYVMNYINVLPEYRDTLDLLIELQHADDEMVSSMEDVGHLGSVNGASPLGHALFSVASVLEANILAKSMLYLDTALQQFFLMNNIYYMVKKVKESNDLRALLGDHWIRAHNVKFRQHALNYERISWRPILSFLKGEGLFNPGSCHPSTAILKKRFKGFSLAFEEIYKTQTGWLIPDDQLREDLRISISLKILQAYRMFAGRYQSCLDGVRNREKYIKFCQDDLENYLMDLFAGSAKSIQSPRRW